MIKTVTEAIIKYYAVEIRSVVGTQDMKKDLLQNLVTNLIISDDIYFLMFNLVSISEQ